MPGPLGPLRPLNEGLADGSVNAAEGAELARVLHRVISETDQWSYAAMVAAMVAADELLRTADRGVTQE